MGDAITELDQNVARLHGRVLGLDGRRVGPHGHRSATTRSTSPGSSATPSTTRTHHLRDVGRGLAALGAGAPRQKGLGRASQRVERWRAEASAAPRGDRPSRSRGRSAGRATPSRPAAGRRCACGRLRSSTISAPRATRCTPEPQARTSRSRASTGRRSDRGSACRSAPRSTEISAFAEPCSKNAQWFVGGNFRRMHHGLHPGWSRAYAWVLEPGGRRAGRRGRRRALARRRRRCRVARRMPRLGWCLRSPPANGSCPSAR